MAADIEEQELVEVTASVSLTFSAAITFEEALREAIFCQPWAGEYPDFAQRLYDDLISNSELISLLQRFPGEVSTEELLAKVGELATQLTNPNMFERLSDLALGTSDVGAFIEAVWNAIEQRWVEVTGDLPPFLFKSFLTIRLNMMKDLSNWKSSISTKLETTPKRGCGMNWGVRSSPE